MRKENGITLVSLVVTIIILIILAGVSINLTLGENGIITKSKQAKEKTEQAKLNEEIALNELYIQMEAEGGEGFNGDNSNVYIAKLAEFKKAIADYIEEAGGVKPEYTAETITFGESIKGIVKEVTKNATATEDKILKDYTAYKDGELITGTMTDNGAVTKSLNAGESYAIAEGYHNGSGKITANSLESQTQATAIADNISKGKTAWVNGIKITGNGKDVNNSYNTGKDKSIIAENLTSKSVRTIDCTGISNYQNLTSDDFIIQIKEIYREDNNSTFAKGHINPVKTYDSITGTLTISIFGGRINAVAAILMKYDVIY